MTPTPSKSPTPEPPDRPTDQRMVEHQVRKIGEALDRARRPCD